MSRPDHLVWVESIAGRTVLTARGYRAVCKCGWKGEVERHSLREADEDGWAHEDAVADGSADSAGTRR